VVLFITPQIKYRQSSFFHEKYLLVANSIIYHSNCNNCYHQTFKPKNGQLTYTNRLLLWFQFKFQQFLFLFQMLKIVFAFETKKRSVGQKGVCWIFQQCWRINIDDSCKKIKNFYSLPACWNCWRRRFQRLRTLIYPSIHPSMHASIYMTSSKMALICL
jgi:hypothetical protein